MSDVSPAVLVERRGPVLEITLDRPKANAIDARTSRVLGEAFAEFRDDPELRAAIFTGAGEKFFTAGWDLAAAAGGEAYESDYGEGGFGGFPELPGLNKPVILAVNGMAVGGGFEMTMCADLAVAAEHALFFLPETAAGIIPDVGSVCLPKLLPRALATEVLILGRRLTAPEAERFGLVNRVVPGERLLETAREMADRAAEMAPLAVAAVLDVRRRTEGRNVRDGLAWLRSGEAETYQRMLSSEDAQEGPRAFTEKRPPVWRGR